MKEGSQKAGTDRKVERMRIWLSKKLRVQGVWDSQEQEQAGRATSR